MQSTMLRTLALPVLAILTVAPLTASTSRTAVSVTGSDGNTATNCSLPTPCRTFAVALGQTTVGGEVVALDSGGFGPFTITQAVTVIAAPGVYAAAQATAGATAVTVNAAGAAVVLRGLTLNGVNGSGARGVEIDSVGTMSIENCVIENFSDVGVLAASGGSYFVVDSIIRGNTVNGLYATGSGPTSPALVTIDNCRIEGNGTGVEAYSNSKITVRNSIVNANAYVGILAGSTGGIDAGGPAEVMVDGSQAAYNGYAGVAARCLFCGVVVYNSHITENVTGVKSDFSGQTLSLGNNTVRYNTTLDGTFGTTYTLQ
jgi:hypothetical protein